MIQYRLDEGLSYPFFLLRLVCSCFNNLNKYIKKEMQNLLSMNDFYGSLMFKNSKR